MILRSALVFICFLLAGDGFAQGRTITLVADKWCPYNCADHPEGRGILVEKAAAALAAEGILVNYIELPWSRAIFGVRDGEYDAIVGAGLAETPDFLFPQKPLAIAHHGFYTLPSFTWEYQGLESLNEIRIGVAQDYSYGGLDAAYISANQYDDSRVIVIRGSNVLPRLIKMLKLGRIDALVAEEKVLNYHFTSQGQENPLRYAGLANDEALYVAFSPALADGAELAEVLGRRLIRETRQP